MFKLCFVFVSFGLIAVCVDAQSISSPFPQPPRNPFLADHLKRTGFYNRNTFDTTYQKNFFRRTFQTPVRTGPFPEYDARIIALQKNVRPNGAYNYIYETENGIRGQERGVQKLLRLGSEPANNVEGSYTYTDPQGLQVLVEYVADQDGFRPVLSYAGVGAARFINGPEPASTVILRQP